MSEVGQQLVDNEQRRDECMRKARRALLELVTKMAAHDQDALAELDVDGARVLLEQLAGQRQVMRNLRKERRELAAAQAAE